MHTYSTDILIEEAARWEQWEHKLLMGELDKSQERIMRN